MTVAFDPVARTLRAELEAFFAGRPDAGSASALSTIDTNSALVEDRGGPLLRALAHSGVPTVEGRRVIDLGCGFGALSCYLASRGADVLGVDRNAASLRVGATVSEAHALPVTFAPGRMEMLDAADTAFDVAVMNNTLCYLVDRAARRQVLREARRVLRPGGSLVVREPNAWHPFDPFTRLPGVAQLPPGVAARLPTLQGRDRPHVRLVSPRTLRRELADAGFTTVRRDPATGGAAARAVRLAARYQLVTAQRPR